MTVTIDVTWVAQGHPQNDSLGETKQNEDCSRTVSHQVYTNADVFGTINGEIVEGIGSLGRVTYPPGGGDGQCKPHPA